jgi:hypothetical protein
MIGVVGGIDQGSCLPHPQVVNLDDHPNSIPKAQPLESLERQTPIFVDNNDHVTPHHTFNQAYDIFFTRACNLLETTSKPNNKVTCKERCLSRESPSIAEAIKGIRAFKEKNDKRNCDPNSRVNKLGGNCF